MQPKGCMSKKNLFDHGENWTCNGCGGTSAGAAGETLKDFPAVAKRAVR
jgi:hypothetical protein